MKMQLPFQPVYMPGHLSEPVVCPIVPAMYNNEEIPVMPIIGGMPIVLAGAFQIAGILVAAGRNEQDAKETALNMATNIAESYYTREAIKQSAMPKNIVVP